MRLLLLFSIFVAQIALATPKEIRLGFVPGEAPEQLSKNAHELARLLQSKIHIPVKVIIPKNYQNLIDQMKNKDVDFAFFTAMTFVLAEKEAQAKVLLKKVWKEPYYYSAILTRQSSKIRSVSGLKGKTIAFVDEKSASGFLYPMVMFKKKKIDTDHFFAKKIFAGNHQAAVRAVVDGKADAAAVFSDDPKAHDSAWTQYAPTALKKKARLLWISEPIPNDPFCVRQDFYDENPKLTHDIMFALIDLAGMEGEPNYLKKLLDVKELKMATSRQYDPVREMIKELKIKL